MTRKPKMSVFEYSEFSSSVQNAWSIYIEKGQLSKKIIRSEILNSWDRSRDFGVDPYKLRIEKMIKQHDLIDNHNKNEKLLTFARPEMQYLAELVKGSQTIITVSDKNGLLLDMYGDPQSLKDGEKIHFMPGAIWSEEVGGTNAIGTVIKSQKPEQILFAEHFCSGWQDWFCAAAPILDPLTNELLGVLDISGKWKNVNPHTLSLAISKATQISKYIGEHIYRDGLEGNPFLVAALGSFDDGVMIIDTKKQILKVNDKIKTFLRGKQLPSIENLTELNDLVNLVFQGTPKNVEREIQLLQEKRKYRCSVQPVIVDSEILGAVIRLREESLPPMMKKTSAHQLHQLTARYTFDQMIGSSPNFAKIVKSAYKASTLDSTLFISGETGTGKELFAQAIHHASKRSNQPFIAINCGAIPRELIESELFGYEPGAFTGAKAKGSPGKFELAQGGTIFLDEIGDMPLSVQIHLLRILEEKTVTRIGSAKSIPIDVRVIAATHRNLMEAVRKGSFRQDLLFRLRVIQLRLPSLRERTSDIPHLVKHFIEHLGPQFGKSKIEMTKEAFKLLQKYPWPGNIRELKNVIEQSLFNMEGNQILPSDLPLELLEGMEAMGALEISMDSEKSQLIEAIRMMGGSISKAAKKLGISRATMYRKVKQYGITNEKFKEDSTD